MPIHEMQGKPGRLWVDELNAEVDLRDRRFGSKYDSVSVAAGLTAAGTQLIFFQNIQGKTLIDTNLSRPSQLDAGELMWIHRVGLYIRANTGDIFVAVNDIKRFGDNAYLTVNMNNLLLTSGPAYEYQSGYGYYGSDAGPNGICSIGVPSLGAAMMLPQPQYWTPESTVQATIDFFNRNWTAGQNVPLANRMPTFAAPITVTLHFWGEILRATTKG